ncbi:hypothetical protein T12_5390 [Trichinella patagoniensis]|uniref:Secreted protein n=1 Tax=Trichinella patagoniensis TaxID=990121 RepID=A0A0V0ZGI2_9BILA|nr:hypothetical protein T12_15458 [Trichinella patagoniensis]KRY18358.1 hypothetical protein T12_5390 [Trichinella patagoniensis]
MTLRFFLIIVRIRSAVNFCYERRHFPLHNGSILVAHPLAQWPTSITQKQNTSFLFYTVSITPQWDIFYSASVFRNVLRPLRVILYGATILRAAIHFYRAPRPLITPH